MSQQEGRDYWERHAHRYDASVGVLRGPMRRMTEMAADAVRDLPKVLEVAAGTGLVTAALAKAAKQVVATDYSAAMVGELSRRIVALGVLNVHVQESDLYSLPFPPKTFDAVVAANVLHLVPDVAGALQALRRVVKPAGRVLVPTFCHGETLLSSVVSRCLSLSGFPGRRRLTAEGLRALVEAEGLRVEKSVILAGVIPITYVEAVVEDAP